MSTLSSRESLVPLTPEDLEELLIQSTLVLSLTQDETIDPPELQITLRNTSQEKILFLTPETKSISLFDLISIFDHIGFTVHYEEKK